MKIISVNHLNEVTVIDLAQIPVYRACLVNTKEFLGIGLKYLTGSGATSSTFSTIMLAGTLVHGLPEGDSTLVSIARVGFQGGGNIAKDKELLHDACRNLRNAISKESTIEDIGTRAESLCDFYYWLKPILLAGAVSERIEQQFGEWLTIFLP